MDSRDTFTQNAHLDRSDGRTVMCGIFEMYIVDVCKYLFVNPHCALPSVPEHVSPLPRSVCVCVCVCVCVPELWDESA